jgi:hypothetical protein
MSVAATAAGSGAVLGLVIALFLQQLGYLALTDLLLSLLLLVGAALVGGVVAGAAGRFVDRR